MELLSPRLPTRAFCRRPRRPGPPCRRCGAIAITCSCGAGRRCPCWAARSRVSSFPLLILALTNSPASAGVAAALFSAALCALQPAGGRADGPLGPQAGDDHLRCRARAQPGQRAAGPGLRRADGLATLRQSPLSKARCFVFFNIAEVAALPRVVAREHLPAATGAKRDGRRRSRADRSVAGRVALPERRAGDALCARRHLLSWSRSSRCC